MIVNVQPPGTEPEAVAASFLLDSGKTQLEDSLLPFVTDPRGERLSFRLLTEVAEGEIQPEAAKELDKLVQLLKDNPTIYIELSAHTDARGSSSYNLRLSELRAMAAYSYITARGIDPQRIVAKGYGENKLINRCKDGINCTKEEHYQNRRTEFAVTRY